MQKYGIDGPALQRFTCELRDPTFKAWRTSVLERIQRLAPQFGRTFYVTYDITGTDSSGLVDLIRQDWDFINSKFNLASHPNYARSDGRPVVLLWGFGFSHNLANPEHLEAISKILRSRGLYIVLGVPYGWRDGGVKPGYNVHHFLANGDMIQPWSVGSFRSSAELYSSASISRSTQDKELCLRSNVEYQRVIWPGFAWSNWNGGEPNMIPRKGGQFMRDQFSFAYQVAPTYSSVFIAMFDEVDEGTAILKAAKDRSMIPTTQYFLTLDADGLKLNPDHYLLLAGELTAFYHNSVAPKCDLWRKAVLRQDEFLAMNCRLHSNSLGYHLLVQNNGELVLYNGQGQAWKAPVSAPGTAPWKLFMQADGNLVLYDGNNKVVWATNTSNKGTAPYRLELPDDGNLVVYDAHNKVIWTRH